MSLHNLSPGALLALLACRDPFPCAEDEVLDAKGACLSMDDDSGPADPDDDTATTDSGDSGAPSARVALLNPTAAMTLYAGTRYDLLARVDGAETAFALANGVSLDCTQSDAGLVHCPFTPEAGPLALEVRLDDSDVDTVSLEVATHAGVIPEGDDFPMGMYEVMDQSWFEPLAGAGYNLAQSYGTGGYTEADWQGWAADWGMWTMARTSWSWSDPWGEPYTDDELAEIASYSQIAWWELPDNAVGDASYADEVADLVDRIRAVDDRPVYMYLWTSTTTEQIEAYLPYLDLVGPGAYPEHACQPQPWIRWRIESAVEAVDNAGYTLAEKPVIGLADLYGQPDAGCTAAELAQVRMNPLAQMAAGAQGILYFAWYYAVHYLDPAWGELALQTSELIMGEGGLGEAVVHGERLGELDVVVTSGAELSEAFTPYGLSETFQYPSLHAAAWDHNGTRYAIAVNYTDEEITANLGGFPAETPGVEVVGEDRVLSPNAGVISETFEAWGAHVYRAPIGTP